uniref:Uncharacterized protein n=1 Tax=Cacopsylla melanoneura TaxID=428564 RepID=A0A8D9FFV2_9HEMI
MYESFFQVLSLYQELDQWTNALLKVIMILNKNFGVVEKRRRDNEFNNTNPQTQRYPKFWLLIYQDNQNYVSNVSSPPNYDFYTICLVYPIIKTKKIRIDILKGFIR